MIDYNDESYLMHYGVLGMKWGVRKDKIKSGSSSVGKKVKKKSNEIKKDYDEYRKERRDYLKKNVNRKKDLYKDLNSLSDSEIQQRINRMNLEMQYSSLTKNQNYMVTRNKGRSLAKSMANEMINKKSSTKLRAAKAAANVLL